MELALDADVDRVHVFIATSDIHLKYKLGISREEAVRWAVDSIEFLKSHGVEVEFSAEDATRSDPAFLEEIYSAAVDAGADILDIPDTVGIAKPEFIRDIVSRVVSISRGRIVSVHCHNDFGLATANSIAGVLAGARQVHVTINGIGERAGNASLEEVVMALKILYGYEIGINTEKLVEVSRLVSKLTGVPVQPNKAIVGRNAFGHESGIHTHGVLRNPATYEPFPPELVGARRWLALGKHAGSHGIRAKLVEMGYEVSEDQLKVIVSRVKMLGDMGRRVTDSDLAEIASEILGSKSYRDIYARVEGMRIENLGERVRIALTLTVGDSRREVYGEGRSTIEASIDAIRKLLGQHDLEIDSYGVKVEQVGDGVNAEGIVVIRTNNGRQITASSIKQDIYWAIAEAAVRALNIYLKTY